MASKRQLKKDMNNTFGEIIEESLLWQHNNPEADHKKAEGIVDDSIKAFDDLNAKVNQRKVENVNTHYKGIHQDFDKHATDLSGRVNKLS